MKARTSYNRLGVVVGLWLVLAPVRAQDLPASGQSAAPIPFAELGAKAGAQYQGDGLSVLPAPEGARLRCDFQKLEGQATTEGLWLFSTADGVRGDRFRVTAMSVGRGLSVVGDEVTRLTSVFDFRFPLSDIQSEPPYVGCYSGGKNGLLPSTGTVAVVEKLARFVRPGLVEEYSVSMDGVRQDFLVLARPGGGGKLRVELDVAGAKAEALVDGARLVLDGSGRKLTYSRLRATDAQGRELSARMEAVSTHCLAVLVDDASATYPVRIDPTFSDANWVSMGGRPGANYDVNAVVVDGSGNLYIGGRFTVVGQVLANYVAKWDGSAWSPLGSGVINASDYSSVDALAVSGTNLYVGGRFTTAGGSPANYIAKWNGSAWSALGSGMIDGSVNALAVSGTDLYVGGYFTTAGGSLAIGIAKWDGSSWSALGSGLNGGVGALAISGTDLYVGGGFTTAGGVAATNIAKWNGNAWSALGSGINANVAALAVSGANLYAGGEFTTAGGVAAKNIARWNGSTWSALGSGVVSSDGVHALAVLGTDVYAGGNSGLAKWNGSTWSAFGGFDNRILALAVSGTEIYVGGSFTTAGGVGADNIAKWNGSAWSGFGSGLNDAVSAVAVSGTNLYVGGSFKAVGGAPSYIARWNGSGWLALGSGLNSNVSALAVSGTNLYVGGEFTTAGGAQANRIAKWSGSAWSALGSGLNSYVYALAVSGSDVYAGGDFTTAGGSAANHIAKWNGSSWSALGSGMDYFVGALAVSGTDLYAGGSFTTAGGAPARFVAKWNGSAWSALGAGVSNTFYLHPPVQALAVSGTDLYVGGDFTTAGGSPANHVAKWNGSAWSALGSGSYGDDVHALAVSGTDLYAGSSTISKWDGSAWSYLGSGLGNGGWYTRVFALAVSGSDLYAGGYFTTAGDKISGHVARASLAGEPAPQLTIIPSGANVVLTWPANAAGFTLQSTTNLVSPAVWTTVSPGPVVVNGQNTVTNATSGTQQFYRLSQ